MFKTLKALVTVAAISLCPNQLIEPVVTDEQEIYPEFYALIMGY